ncbi:hypothetical protein H4R18_001705 [Coemansia javaensis]|uniref:PSP proline-rich domain-containing protein n=1 Tax=Coemansia javaensis TaxID=2761396 RepID=A0A9W8HJU6_9FUNG|nr:hypothetical protein H4R18_001705 [Coemansia javaensis]
MSLNGPVPQSPPAPTGGGGGGGGSGGGNKRRKKKSRRERDEADEARRQRLLQELSGSAAPQLPSNVTVEYVEQKPDVDGDSALAGYSAVFEQFAANAARSFGVGDESDAGEDAAEQAQPGQQGAEPARRDDGLDGSDGSEAPGGSSSSSSDEDGDAASKKRQKTVSRKVKRQNRISVAELKQRVARPEVVEWTDTSAQDPELLIALKSVPNTVPVPAHWSQKKKYLQYKRGTEKAPFELPGFIRATGIMEMREAAAEDKTSKATARERMRPKMNRLNLDYQRLHDAFFRFQTPPPNMTGHGDLFYESKESDVSYDFTPGAMSDALKAALNIPPLAPPPWLVNMQRYGPPPSYPSLAIPGLNAPIPPGAQWGYHPGGWGRPPVDELGRPLYGDVFSDQAAAAAPLPAAPAGPRKYWGDLEANESSDEEDEEEDEEDEEAEPEAEEGGEAAAEPEGAEPPAVVDATELTDDQLRSGVATMAAGLETPSTIQLRKQAGGDAGRALYTVLPEQETARLEGIMGSQFTYDMSKALDPSKKPSGKAKHGVEIALDAAELEDMDEDTLRARYEQAEAAAHAHAHAHAPGEDLSDMVADHVAAQARKRKAAAASSSAAAKKKSKEFKF